MKYIVFIFLMLATHCGVSQELKPGEGFVKVEGGKIWYKIVGEGKGVPLLLIHGGPGSRSCSGIPTYSRLSDERPVIFYDQLGSGNSDTPWDTKLWRPARFANEIDSLRKALGLNKLHILGHSWGGTVLIEYMSRRPKGVVSAIFAAPLISTSVWINDAKLLLSQMPKNIQDTIRKYEKQKNYIAPSYLMATDSFYARYLLRHGKEDGEECASSGAKNNSLYNYMWGPTEFNATGTLKYYDRTNDLPKLQGRVLFITGEYDEARPATVRMFSQKVKGSKLVVIPDSGHYMHRDQPVVYVNALREFLRESKQ
ncbi:MAG TPA: proline iminopeptidase-family hydrolase [Chitinophagaceae bacterium]|nr:proline iminopeptidase-family hydrolase [Chitinophagaceae bacterium]